MPYVYDATLKYMLGQDPQAFGPVFKFPNFAPLRTLNVDLSTMSAATDAAYGFGEPLREIVDLNFQSGPDSALPARVRLYNAAFHFKCQVPVLSVVVLLRPKADGPNLTGELSDLAGTKGVKFEYEVIRMRQQPVEPFLHGGLGLLPLARLCKLPEGEDEEKALKDIVTQIDRRLAQMPDHAAAVQIMTAAFILSGLRVAKEAMTSIFQGVRVMHDSSAYDVIRDEGIAIGIERGLLQGSVESRYSPWRSSPGHARTAG